MTISLQQYFGKPHSAEEESDAEELLVRVNALLVEAQQAGVYVAAPDGNTGSEISGSRGGDGDGGFRTPASHTGVVSSAHRQARAVDVHDPSETLENWITTFEGEDGSNSKLQEYDLYREAPASTIGWVHLQTRAPGSGRRTFNP